MAMAKIELGFDCRKFAILMRSTLFLTSPLHYFFILSILVQLCLTSLAMPPLTLAYDKCSSGVLSSNEEAAYRVNMETLFSELTKSALSVPNNGSSVGLIWGYYQCRGDLSLPDCALCMESASANLSAKCSGAVGGRIQLDGCFLRFDNHLFYSGAGVAEEYLEEVMAICSTAESLDGQDRAALVDDMYLAVNGATARAPEEGGFATAKRQSTYALAQCLGYLSPGFCVRCLSNKLYLQSFCNQTSGGQIHFSSCYYRYEHYLFFNEPLVMALPPSQTLPSRSDGLGAGSIAGIVLVVFFSVIILAGLLIKRTRHRLQNTGTTGALIMDPLLQGSFLLTYDELRTATQNFHIDQKLGQGGFGPVYKGTLADGRVVAIKMLSSSSHQGKEEFMNEVKIINSIRHRNLIKLLGCCIEGSERLLVYEYLPNRSLDVLLFGSSSLGAPKLTWDVRREIIVGVAQGLAYLHEGSDSPIIHRDIKASNILLDHEMTPKISDFGLARLYSEGQSHVITSRIAGTFGYVAPEYALYGKLSEKVDVFSFGLVALEAVTGRRNHDLQQPLEKELLLAWAWKMFNEGRQVELVDPRLEGDFVPDEVVRIINISLLCTQASPGLRPTMSSVVGLLLRRSESLQRPRMPGFVSIPSDNGDEHRSSMSIEFELSSGTT